MCNIMGIYCIKWKNIFIKWAKENQNSSVSYKSIKINSKDCKRP